MASKHCAGWELPNTVHSVLPPCPVGQQQRVAIARAIVQGANVVLADEPIASLDPESSRKVMDILARVNREDKCTVIVSLH